MRQNYPRSKKEISRIILPDDSSEEGSTVHDQGKSNIEVNPSAASKKEQQGHY